MQPIGPDSVDSVRRELIAGPMDFDADGALTREFLLRRGNCCREGCRNCPYGFSPEDAGESG